MADAEQLINEMQRFVLAEAEVHRVYGDTTACFGGIGGQALTPHCAMTCDNSKHDAAREEYEQALYSMRRRVEEARHG